MIKKEDWENARTQWENMCVNALINAEVHKAAIKVCEKKISSFPDDDPMPEGLKEDIMEVKDGRTKGNKRK